MADEADKLKKQLETILGDIEQGIARLSIEGITDISENIESQFSSLKTKFQSLGTDITVQIKNFKALRGQVRASLNAYTTEAASTLKTFTAILQELTKGKEATNKITSATRQLASVQTDLLGRRERITDLSDKELDKIEKKINYNELLLKYQEQELSLAQGRRNFTEKDQTALNNARFLLKDNLGLISNVKEELSAAREEQKFLNNSFGLTSKLLKAIVDTPGLAGVSKFFNLNEIIDESKERFQTLVDELKQSPKFADDYFKALSRFERQREKVGLRQEFIVEKTDQLKEVRAERKILEKKSIDPNITDTEKEVIRFDLIRISKEEEELKDLIKKRTQGLKSMNLTLDKARENLSKVNKEIFKSATTGVEKLTFSFKIIGDTVKKSFKALIDPLTLTTATLTTLTKGFLAINEQTTLLTKNLVLSTQQASALRSEFTSVADNSGKTFITTKSLIEAQNEFNRLLGLQGKLNTDNAETFVRLQKAVGVSTENAAKLQFFAEATGESFEQQYLTQLKQTQELSEQFGVQLNQRVIFDEIGQQSAYTLAQFQGSTQQLGEAVALAKALGLELSTVNKIAGQLLEFETSITDELQAELLLGRDINLENARLAALNNDQLTLMRELNQEVGTFNDFSSMNRIQQEAIAQALGLSVEEMADMLLLQQYERKNRDEIVALEGEAVANRVETLSLQQRFNDAVEKLQDLVVNLVEGPLGQFASFMADVAKNSVLLEASIGALAGLSLVRLVGSLGAIAVQMGILSAGAITLSSALTFGLGAIAIGGGIAAALAYYNRAKDEMTRVDDFISPGYGKRMLFDEGELIALNDKDNVIATTNPIQNTNSLDRSITSQVNKQSTSNQSIESIANNNYKTIETTPTMSPNVNVTPNVVVNTPQQQTQQPQVVDNSQELKAIKSVLEKIATSEGSINMNGTKFGTVTAMNTYQIQ